jgi:peptidyl-prolyl cis-trans isomerase D
MFEFVRTHSRLMLGLIVLLIIPSFVFFGVQGYSRMTSGENASVAKVDGRAITKAEWDQAHQRAIDRMRQQAPTLDVKLLDTPQMRQETLDALVRERVLLAAANDQHLFPTDERLQRLFVSDPQFAGLRNPDGSVNRDILAAQGMSSEMLAQQLRTEFGMQQVLGGVGRSVVAPTGVAAPALDARLQQRELQWQLFETAAYRGKVAPSEADIESYYKAHETEFRAPEQASIEYVVLDLDTLAKDVTVPPADLQRYYEENASRYTVAEERRARHILIQSDAGAPKAEREKAKARAEELLAQVRAKPADFAALARKYSQDPGSAERGGDLDFFGRGAMVKPFEDAVFAMKPGEISNVIETDFGYHIIQLTEVRGGQKRPFESVRAEVEAEVRKSLAQRRYAEAAEQFTNTVYEQPDSLQPVIDKFKLDKRTATVGREPAPGATGALASTRLLEAVFGNDALNLKRNTDAIEVGPNQLVSARVVSHQPEHTLPLAEVRERVRQAVVEEQAKALARKEGEARLAEVKAAAEVALPKSGTVSRAQLQGLPRAVVDAALRADPAALPATQGVDLGEQGYAVLRVLRVLPRDPAAGGGDAALRGQYAQAWAAAEAQAYYDALKLRYKVKVDAPKPAAATP